MDERNREMTWREYVGATISLIVLVTSGVSIYLVRAWLPWIGYIWLGAIGMLPFIGLAFVFKYLLKYDFRDIGQVGTIAERFGGLKEIKPYALASPAIDSPKTKVSVTIPTVAELLKSGAFGTTSLLFGFLAESGSALWGSWSDINTFCIAGKSRSGKTITLFFIILQAVLNGAIVVVVDPHGAGRKQSALKKLLEPLHGWIRFACTEEEIDTEITEFMDAMIARVDGQSDDETPRLFVCDEFNGAAEANSRLYELVNRCAREWAGFGGYAAIAGHEWTQAGKASQGLAKMRRNLHAKFVHRIEGDYAKYLLSGKWVKQTEHLRTGHNIFVNRESEVFTLITPLGKVEDAQTVAEQLLQLTGPEYVPSLEEGKQYYAETKSFVETETPGETNNFEPKLIDLPASQQSETKRFDSYEARKEKVRELRKAGGFNQSTIIQTIWRCRPGDSEAYRQALGEYKEIVEEIAHEAIA